MIFILDYLLKNRPVINAESEYEFYVPLVNKLDQDIDIIRMKNNKVFSKIILAYKINDRINSIIRFNSIEKEIIDYKEKISIELDKIEKHEVVQYYLDHSDLNLDGLGSSFTRSIKIEKIVKSFSRRLNRIKRLYREIKYYFSIQYKVKGQLDLLTDNSLRLSYIKRKIFRQRLNYLSRSLSYNNMKTIDEKLNLFVSDFEAVREYEAVQIDKSKDDINDLLRRLSKIESDYPQYYSDNSLDSRRHHLLELRSKANLSKYVLDKICEADNEIFTIERTLPMLDFSRKILNQRKNNFNQTVDLLSASKQENDAIRQLRSRVSSMRSELDSQNLKNASNALLDAKDKLILNIV